MFDGAMAEIFGQVAGFETKGGKDALVDMIMVYTDNLITGDFHSHASYIKGDSAKFHTWVKVPSPRVITVAGNRLKPFEVYLEPGASLGINLSADGKNAHFTGELAQVNSELFEAPKLDMERINNAMEQDSTLSPAKVMAIYDDAERQWLEQLRRYIGSRKLSDKGRLLLTVLPAYKRAGWMLSHERRLGLDELTPLSSWQALHDYFSGGVPMLAQPASGGTVQLLMRSGLLRRAVRPGQRNSFIDRALDYFNRYDIYTQVARTERLPLAAQLAVCRSLCAGGILKQAGDSATAMALIDTLSVTHIANPALKARVKRYARHLYGDRSYQLPLNSDTDFLSRLLAPWAGKAVVLDFWSYLCPPCRKEMSESKHIREMADRSGKVAVVYVTADDIVPREQYDEFVSGLGLAHRTILLSRPDYDRLHGMFDVKLIPRHVVIGADRHTVLDDEFTPDSLPALIERL